MYQYEHAILLLFDFLKLKNMSFFLYCFHFQPLKVLNFLNELLRSICVLTSGNISLFFNVWVTHHYRASLVAQLVWSLPAIQETCIQSLGQEDLLEKEMATHSNILTWRIPWTEEPGRLQSMGS